MPSYAVCCSASVARMGRATPVSERSNLILPFWLFPLDLAGQFLARSRIIFRLDFQTTGGSYFDLAYRPAVFLLEFHLRNRFREGRPRLIEDALDRNDAIFVRGVENILERTS